VSATLPDSTLQGLESHAHDVHGLWARRGILTLLTLVLVAGAVGLLGAKSTTVSDTGEGWTLEVERAVIARGGLDVPFNVTVTHEGGFGEKVTLAVTGTYLDIYETQGFHPEPDSTTRDAETLYLTFTAPPDGEVLTVAYDAYIQPAAQSGAEGTLSVMDEGLPVVTVDIGTTVLP
jgi:hypothetical protein